ncbi:MAG TPA: hypothetical protein VMJ10_10035 [Kofleriaceae bacterium]|nr:hypothetical protein [Kofleriaceae bacterium]
MMFLPALAVVFAGILNGGHSGVDRQLKPILHDLHVQSVAVPAATLRSLTHHSDATRDLVRKLHADGVIGLEIVTGHGAPTLRLVIYDGNGGLKTFTEISLNGRGGLAADDLDVLRQNLTDDVTSLGGDVAAPPPEVIEPAPAPTPPKPVPPPKHAPAPAAPAQEIEIDDTPAVLGATPAAAPQHAARPTETADASDAVSADEIAAMTGGGDDATGGGGAGPAVDELHAQSSAASVLHLGGSVGFGIASRAFTPSAATVAAYGTSPVGAVSLEAHVQPTERIALAVAYDHTLDLTTPMSDQSIAATTISRWEAYGTYALARHGAFELGARVGAGHRAFSIDSTVPGRSPDSDYEYAIAGLTGATKLGDKLALRGLAALEPVFGGVQATEMSMGASSRWALDVGAAIEYRPYAHVYARAAAEYQRFSWSWDMPNARSGGGATDEYPSGTLSLGADY